MALFSGFNQIRNSIRSVRSVASQVSSITSGASNAFSQLGGLSDAFSRTGIGQAFNTINRVKSVAEEFQSVGSLFSNGFGTRTRMSSNALQGVTTGAEPPSPNQATATIINDNSITSGGIDPQTNDWRVSLSVPDVIKNSPLFTPFNDTNNKMVFPFNPTILFGNSANYSQIAPIHSNYPYYAYENSQVDAITIAGEYFSQNEQDALYWIAVLHFLRTMTKMFYGGGANSGSPPLLTRLNGYGKHVMNNIPCVVQTFSVDLPSDVDYIQVNAPDGTPNYVPTRAQVNVTLQPQYSRLTQSRFDLVKFANGEFVSNDANNTGFI